jgi:hypothetical protein
MYGALMNVLKSIKSYTSIVSLLSLASLVLAGAQGYKWG